ncbi:MULTISPECIES: hypothetical protein [unclassified Streptomyces]|uniref:hypothetical protein n=1 Tax=unclassified Streptomyces TaxID=2593676 RepID=UPI00225283BA|nr:MULTISPECIES: hypothetical protein [unclassified Streptomyces]MCX4878394.1 hypothetical protein [Streptomyces sp. NBC_00847]
MGPLLALTSAVRYAIVDFTDGLPSRCGTFAATTFLGQLGGLLLAGAAAFLVPADAVRPEAAGTPHRPGADGRGRGRARPGPWSARRPAAVARRRRGPPSALPVVLGLALLHERVTRRQTAGLLGAAAATVLLTLG